MGRPRKMKAHFKRQGGSTKPQPDSLLQGFTMQQQARNTEGRTRTWSALRLRHKAIHFVAANDTQPDNVEDSAVTKSDGGQQELKTNPETAEAPEKPEAPIPEAEDTAVAVSTPDSPKFFVDLEGENIASTGLPNTVPRLSLSGSDDSSDEEVIVFRGRNRSDKSMSPFHAQTRPVEDESEISFSDRDHFAELKNETSRNETRPSGTLNPSLGVSNGTPPIEIPMSPLPSDSRISPPMGDADDEGYMEPNTRHAKKGKHEALFDDNVDIVADYIANIDQDYAKSEHTETQESEDDNVNNLKATDNVEQDNILHRAYSESSENLFDQSSDLELEDPDIYTNSDLEFEDSFDDFDPNEKGLRAFRDLERAVEEVEDGHSHRPRRGHNNIWGQPYLSASSFADALEHDPYYGLDVMDFDRPSLTKRGKGKRRNADLMLSDSELEFELQRAWKNDREKKKSKKQKREELRSQGLLGRSADKPNLKAKYSGGMDIDDLRVELRTFVMSSRDNLPLPSMDKQRRKLVHDLANALSLKSQSRGDGPSRFPVLYKTSRTPKYTPRTIFRFEKVFSGSKFNNRMVKAWGRQEPSKSTKAPHGRPKAAVSYMDGDVVGASAPEIGTGNKGRAMLEKMGWSTGTALGATNNKGILQPVAHVVKNSRVGLG